MLNVLNAIAKRQLRYACECTAGAKATVLCDPFSIAGTRRPEPMPLQLDVCFALALVCYFVYTRLFHEFFADTHHAMPAVFLPDCRFYEGKERDVYLHKVKIRWAHVYVTHLLNCQLHWHRPLLLTALRAASAIAFLHVYFSPPSSNSCARLRSLNSKLNLL